MNDSYSEDDYLMLSGIQHFAFCPRQWCLIHLENVWDDNIRTVEGTIIHENAHDPFFRNQKKGVIISRAMAIRSTKLGLSGECDIVEFSPANTGVSLPLKTGKYNIFPVEYKRGSPKNIDADELQLCAQAMCLEEMFCTHIFEGALFYFEIKRRENVNFTDEMRKKVLKIVTRMHDLAKRGETVKPIFTKSCNACSLKEYCLPKLSRVQGAEKYIQKYLADQYEKDS